MLEKGSKDKPTGNLIIYCHVIGENPIQPGAQVIASNVVVSFLKINDNFPVVTFPPISFQHLDELKKIIYLNEELYDLVKLPDFRMPDDKEQGNNYIQSRMEQYNHFVMRYVEMCKNREKNPTNEIYIEGVKEYIEALTKLSSQFRTSTGITKDTTQMKLEDLIHKFSVSYPQFDLENYQKALYFPGQKGETLIQLYIQKFQAIHNEKYETASVLKKQIIDIESTWNLKEKMEELKEIYNSSIYKITDLEIEIYLNRNNPQIDSILNKNHHTTWAFISAFNPYSILVPDELNEQANNLLEQEIKNLKFEFFLGTGESNDESFPIEKNFFILGINLENSISIAKKFEQNAFIFGKLKEKSELIFVEY